MIYQLASSEGLHGYPAVHLGGRRSLGRFAGASLRGMTRPRYVLGYDRPPVTLEEWKTQYLAGLGINAGQVIGASAPIAGAATSGIISSVAAGTALASWAGPIGAGVGAIVGVIGGLFAAHAARAKGAKTENDAINAYLPAFDQGLQTIFQQANSGQLAASDAITAVNQLWAQWWANISPYTSGPGRADASKGGTNCGNGQLNPAGPCTGTPGGHKCDKSCTAGCCVGCQDLYPTILQAIQVFQNPAGGTITACTVYGSSYGASQRGSYTLTYKPPAAAGVAASLGSALNFGGSSGGGSSLFVLALIAGGVYLATR